MAAPINRYVNVTTIKDSVLTFLLFIFLIYQDEDISSEKYVSILMKDFCELMMITHVHKRKTHSAYHFHQLVVVDFRWCRRHWELYWCMSYFQTFVNTPVKYWKENKIIQGTSMLPFHLLSSNNYSYDHYIQWYDESNLFIETFSTFLHLNKF